MLSRRTFMAIAVLSLGLHVLPSSAATLTVTIDKMVFTPAVIEAKVGDTIEWINKDRLVHTATVKGGWEVMIPAGKTVTSTVERAEAVDYYCRFHPNMKGSLTATAP